MRSAWGPLVAMVILDTVDEVSAPVAWTTIRPTSSLEARRV